MSSDSSKQSIKQSKKKSSPKAVRVVDERDAVWSSVENLTVGLTPDERYEVLKKLDESLPTKSK
jgi:hypothetical protein